MSAITFKVSREIYSDYDLLCQEFYRIAEENNLKGTLIIHSGTHEDDFINDTITIVIEEKE